MKTLLQHTFLLLLLAFTAHTAQAQVAINEENFPDDNFRNYLLKQRYGTDGVLTQAEIADINSLSVTNKNISSLQGIEYLTALTKLDCEGNHLITLDVSNCTALTELNCRSNQLTALDVTNNTTLTTLDCGSNQLTTLDVANNTSLKHLSCNNNQLNTLDVTNNTALTTLFCLFNQLNTLDLSKNIALTVLRCGWNQLTALDLSKNTALTELNCYRNQLTALDLSKNTALTTLICNNNQLTTLDVSKNTALTTLICYKNKITTLNVQGCTVLKNLSCLNNQLTTLDLSSNTALTDLYCDSNQLTTLDVSKTRLLKLHCHRNKIRETAMDALIAGMKYISFGGDSFLVIDLSSEEEGNVCTTTQVAAAKAKKWTPYAYDGTNWVEYEGSDPTGIRNVEVDTQDNAPYYTLDGQRMAGKPAKKGLYIRNGKKIVVK